ncbi:MAG: hypothetical protein KJZ68_11180, partial [Phycisphaerales bacterium]|nr:hypothetical protein [Phycisphaerales bacterium]
TVATEARADIVHFVNPDPGEEGHYNWHWRFAINWESWLDITRASNDQPNVRSGNAVGQVNRSTSDFWNETNGGASVAIVLYEGEPLTSSLAGGAPVAEESFVQRATHIFSEFEVGPFITTFDMGVVQYMGVRTESGNFGWIAVRRGTTRIEWFSFEVLEWAYETVPGKGINAGEVPAPGALAAFALLPIFFRSRRRSD